MRVRIHKEVEVDTEVSIGIDEIQVAISDAIEYARDNPRAFTVGQHVLSCWQGLNALTDEQIGLLAPSVRRDVAKELRKLADRFFKIDGQDDVNLITP